ncbi:MAG: pantoate--beta-alanine ligase [Phycisphaerae bacterium]|nr:pantoate--beta-alanine ligase [Phycisphaerae bacterium]
MTQSPLNIFRTVLEWRTFRSTLPPDQFMAFVPTMGALHEGHGSLVKLAGEIAGRGGHVCASIFVNPTQFGPGEDFTRYPRPLAADVELLTKWGAQSLFAPEGEEMYPHNEPAVTVDPGPMADILEGAIRPGHFRGVCTVVAKLLHIIAPTHLLLGQKDFQQQLILCRMVMDFNFPLEVITVPTVREPDGLAMSSRNRYLNADDRAKATAIYDGLQRAAAQIHSGQRDAAVVCRTIRETIAGTGLSVDYALACHPETLQPHEPLIQGPCLLLAAARAGSTRLIDNVMA